MSDERVSFDEARARDYSLRVEVGNASAPDGLTRVHLDGGGRFTAELTFAEPRAEVPGKEERKRGPAETEIAEDQAARVLRQASQFDWDRDFPPRPGIPDEAIVVWTYRVRGTEVATMRAWLRDVEQDPTMTPVLTALREATAELTGGDIYL